MEASPCLVEASPCLVEVSSQASPTTPVQVVGVEEVVALSLNVFFNQVIKAMVLLV